jgi:ADP-dependent NAD(P)H-hydrate dehydratase
MKQPSCRNIGAAWFKENPLPRPSSTGDKETKGHALVVAGSHEMPGAALLCCTAAFRAGAGKVSLLTAESVASAIAVAMPECRVISGEETSTGAIDAKTVERLSSAATQLSALLVGPGTVGSEDGASLIRALLRTCKSVPMVLDAEAMDHLQIPRDEGVPVLITPHAGELAHLTGMTKAHVVADPVDAAIAAAADLRVLVLLKGSTSVLANSEGAVWSHESREPGLGTSGSGDVLAGVIIGLVARGASLACAAAWGVAAHARCGARLASRVAEVGYLARELAAEVPHALADLARSGS